MNYKTAQGMSLIELLITLTVLAALCAAVTPSTNLLAKHQLSAGQSDLHLLIVKARQDALTLSTRITLCALTADNHCSQNWQGTISEFTDANGNRALDAQEQLLSSIDIHPKILTRWQGMRPKNSIHFSSTGSTFVSNGTFTQCHPALTESLKLIINRQGRTRATHQTQTCTRLQPFNPAN
jgi:type IV fimbrial biogenesis protein FimT